MIVSGVGTFLLPKSAGALKIFAESRDYPQGVMQPHHFLSGACPSLSAMPGSRSRDPCWFGTRPSLSTLSESQGDLFWSEGYLLIHDSPFFYSLLRLSTPHLCFSPFLPTAFENLWNSPGLVLLLNHIPSLGHWADSSAVSVNKGKRDYGEFSVLID